MNEVIAAFAKAWKDNGIYAAVGALAASILLGWGGYYRPDPFTGAEGQVLVDRISRVEEILPKSFPPLEWQVWRASIAAQLDALRVDDRHTQSAVDELQNDCNSHNSESEKWKRRIERNEQSIDNLWQWYQQRMQ